MGPKKIFILCHLILPFMVGMILAPIGDLNFSHTCSVILWCLFLSSINIPALCFKQLWPLKTANSHSTITYGVTKSLSFAVFFYGYWLINSLLGWLNWPILPVHWYFLLVFACFMGGLAFHWKKGQQVQLLEHYKPSIFLLYELPAALLFVAYLMFFSLSPDLRWGEKQMDYNLLSYFYRLEMFPPKDPWFFEKNINYYYFGHFISASLGKLTKLPVILAYILSLASILSLFWCSCVSLFYRILKKADLAVTASFVFLFSCNFYSLYLFFAGKGIVDYQYFLATFKVFEDGNFAGFPMWYFFLKDLHAFMFNYPYIMCFLFILLSFYRLDLGKQMPGKALLLAFCMACFFLINTWDFVIYGTVALCFLVVKIFADKDSLKKWMPKYCLFGGMVLGFLLALLCLYIPSILAGKAIVLKLNPYRSTNDLMVHIRFLSHWMLLLVLGLVLYFQSKRPNRFLFQAVCALLLSTAFFIVFTSNFIWMDLVNTFFKIYNNIWFFLGISALALWFYLFDVYNEKRYHYLRQFHIGFTCFFISCMLFGIYLNGYGSVNHDYFRVGRERNLWGDRFVARLDSDAYQIIQWINQNISGTPHMVEAYGKSFDTYDSLVSTYTGLPSYLGWAGHTFIRGIPFAEIEHKKDHINFIYNDLDAKKVYDFLKTKQIQYLVVAGSERLMFNPEGLAKFAQNPQFFVPLLQLKQAGFYQIK